MCILTQLVEFILIYKLFFDKINTIDHVENNDWDPLDMVGVSSTEYFRYWRFSLKFNSQ